MCHWPVNQPMEKNWSTEIDPNISRNLDKGVICKQWRKKYTGQ